MVTSAGKLDMQMMASAEGRTGLGSLRRSFGQLGAGLLSVSALVALAGQIATASRGWQLAGDCRDLTREQTKEWMQKAFGAVQSGDTTTAEQALQEALSWSSDPGWVAFHWGVFEYQRQRYREAELWFERVLADPECPPQRSAHAWYNWGLCLLQRGKDAPIYRQAIVCFQRSLQSGGLDPLRTADARYHLEVAKWLWNEARQREAPQRQQSFPPTPDEDLHAPPRPSRHRDNSQLASSHQGEGSPAPKLYPEGPAPSPPTGPPGTESPPRRPSRIIAGAGSLEPLRDTSTVQPLTPEDTQAYLRQTAERLRRDRQNLLRTLHGPERFDLRDW